MTTEKKDTPAAKEPENPWAFLESPREEPPEREDVLHLKDVSKSWLAGYLLNKGCTFLIIILGVLIGIGAIFGEIEDRARLNRRYAFDCISRLSQIGKGLHYLVDPDRKDAIRPRPGRTRRNRPSSSGRNTPSPI